MSKPKIKFKLIKLERALVFQVLEQDERFRCKCPASLRFKAKNGFMVESVSNPSISSFQDVVCVRGDCGGEDLEVSVRRFKDNTERDDYFYRTITALRDWAENAPQFAEDKQVAATTEPDAYQF